MLCQIKTDLEELGSITELMQLKSLKLKVEKVL